MPDGEVQERDLGTPQCGVISPLLANLFLHYAFDRWMAREIPEHPVRTICGRCRMPLSERAAGQAPVRYALERRLAQCGLTLHPAKTKIVYCQDSDRRQSDIPSRRLIFWGTTFSPQTINESTGSSTSSASVPLSATRRSKIHPTDHTGAGSCILRSDKALADLARMFGCDDSGMVAATTGHSTKPYALEVCPSQHRPEAGTLGHAQIQTFARSS